MNNTNNGTCQLEKSDIFAATLAIPILQVLLNFVVAVAAIRSRLKLQNNYVYLYVLSMLAANIVFGLFAGYTMANRVFLIEETKLYFEDSQEGLRQQTWWVWRNATVLTMFLVMSANVSSLMYGLRESSYFVGPGSAAAARRKIKSRKSIRQKRNKAIAVVLATWFVPLILAIAAMAGWNCLSQCSCHGVQSDWQNFCSREAGDGCSRILPPLTSSFLLVIASLWIVLALGIGIMLFTTIKKFVSTLESSRSPSLSQRATDNEAAAAEPISAEIGQPHVANEHNGKVNCCKLSSFNYTVRVMIWIAVLFSVCSFPIVITIFLDCSVIDKLNISAVTISYTFALVYCILTPVLLVVYMLRLRQAVFNLFTCCTTTVIQRGPSTYSTTST